MPQACSGIWHSSMSWQVVRLTSRNPGGQLQENDPTLLTHVALFLQPPLSRRHSFTSEHCNRPSPLYPTIQLQLNVPGTLMQSAFEWHCLPKAHSSTSLQKIPSPSKPVRHVQLNKPGKFSHEARGLQRPIAHSSTSTHWF